MSRRRDRWARTWQHVSPVILMYHRVASPTLDPWALAVSPALFEDQMAALRLHRLPLSMNEFNNRLQAGRLPADAIAVTFDDGYVDNLVNAKPILAKSEIPATLFLATGFVGCKTEFWWDELARLVLGRDPLAKGPDRREQYQALWRELQPLHSPERELALSALRHPADLAAEPGDLPMSGDQVRALTADGLISLGAHTVNHPRLTDLPPAEQLREVLESLDACERLAGTRPTGFAYPFGALDRGVRDVVAKAGVHWACTTHAAAVDRRTFDRLALPRLAAAPEDGDGLLRRLRSLHAGAE